ncbi:MAG: acyl-CoA/acyl-ACP dehydrogenase [Pseudomonadales bacterium]|nr:acyl-CoA/acyl-ACP dehydrogenase [Pseudomonadales bacterium]
MSKEASATVGQTLDAIVDRIGREILAPLASDVDSQSRFPSEAFAAFRENGLLGAYVPSPLGGLGVNMRTLSHWCETLGNYCASTAMIFAMHQIQVACLVHHAGNSDHELDLIRQIARDQLLLGSATTEIGTGGDLGSSICAAEQTGDRVKLEKQAPVISYAEDADVIMVTARANPQATANDQVHVWVERTNATMQQIATWDALGFRGTRSLGYRLSAEVTPENVMSVPFGLILSRTMQPTAHILWSSLWLGMAENAASIARRSIRAASRKAPVPPTTSLRMAEMDEAVQQMRATLESGVESYQQILDTRNWQRTSAFSFGLAMNNIKISCSEALVDIVGKAMAIAGINAYRNDHEHTLGRHLRDAYGAMLMVNNDRIRTHNAAMQLAQR